MRNARAPAFDDNEDEERDSRNDDVEPKEGADPGCEQFLEKQRHVQAVFHEPGEKFPIRQGRSDEAKEEVEVAQSHEKVVAGLNSPSGRSEMRAMNGTAPQIEIIAPFRAAFEWMKMVLFRP